MENEVGIRELKQNPSAAIARVKAGEEITVTERGEPVARLTCRHKSIFDQL
jgi:prevent-host-death family protein